MPVVKDFITDVRQFVLKQFPLARKQMVQDGDALLEGGLLDSQGMLEVVIFIEQQFGVVVADEDLTPDNFKSIETIAAFIHFKRNSTEQA